MRPNLWVFLAAAALVPAAAVADDDATDNHNSVRATATINGCINTAIHGRAILSERPSREGVKLVDVALYVTGMTPGKHAIHIHATGNCTPCGAAGGHFDPGPNSNPTPDGNHPFHSGDLINVVVGSRGVWLGAHHDQPDHAFPWPLSVFDADGSAFIVHDLEDTYCPAGPVANCAGGTRAACGIIRLEP